MTDNTKKETARTLAHRSLMGLEKSGRYSNLEVNSAIMHSDLSEADRGLYTRLVYGVTERRITLDYIISQYSSKPTDELDEDVKTALRLGIYQLLWLDRVPDHSAVDESVGLVSRQKRGFVNAVLRSFLRGGKKYSLPDESNYSRYLSVKYSVPAPLVELFMGCAGDEIEDLLCAMNREPHIGLRVNRLKLTTDEAVRMTGGRVSDIAPDVVIVDTLDETVKQGLSDGLWFVQDEASRITSAAVGAKSDELVVDTCACPGGKSFSMAIDMENRGVVRSFDLHANKLSLIRSGAEKLGIAIIETAERDARQPMDELIGKADRVLCDAPCSGLGVIAKKPDIRYKNLADVNKLPEIQYGVLCGASKYVKDGGVLVYSTCTINKAENEDVVERFLRENPEFSLENDPYLGGGMRTFLPHRDGCDGFFAAKMRKTK
ncbi:MAG: 16S rRNA (cytosine(967)-C(5))-methyltransferase RsmB [Ruminococcaceae bacterium]|nr:16S rRNA (cytosine(967)-C(5))-methyltransferase RsmB [Oscillospiraceae bacterium]